MRFDPVALSNKFRSARDVYLRELILAERQKITGTFRILDIGGRPEYWQRVGMGFIEANDITITCVNYMESELDANRFSHPAISSAVGDGRALPYQPGDFHFVHSNSVIEHVGGFADKARFAAEVARLAQAYYVQTPYFWFPIDPHWPRFPFFHWLPMSWRYRLLLRYKLGFAGPYRDMAHAIADLEGTVLLDLAQMRSLFPGGRIRLERFVGLPKSVIVERRT
jgi:hypothetical protein